MVYAIGQSNNTRDSQASTIHLPSSPSSHPPLFFDKVHPNSPYSNGLEENVKLKNRIILCITHFKEIVLSSLRRVVQYVYGIFQKIIKKRDHTTEGSWNTKFPITDSIVLRHVTSFLNYKDTVSLTIASNLFKKASVIEYKKIQDIDSLIHFLQLPNFILGSDLSNERTETQMKEATEKYERHLISILENFPFQILQILTNNYRNPYIQHLCSKAVAYQEIIYEIANKRKEDDSPFQFIRLALEKNQIEDAITIYKKANPVYGNSNREESLIYQACIQHGKSEILRREASTLFRDCCLPPQRASMNLEQQIFELIGQGKIDEAISAAEKDSNLLRKISEMLSYRGDIENAIAVSKKISERGPRDSSYKAIAIAYAKKKDVKNSLSYFKKMFDNRYSDRSKMFQCIAYSESGNIDRALKIAESPSDIKDPPGYSNLYSIEDYLIYIATASAEQGNVDSALQILKEKYDPQLKLYYVIYRFISTAFRMHNDLEEVKKRKQFQESHLLSFWNRLVNQDSNEIKNRLYQEQNSLYAAIRTAKNGRPEVALDLIKSISEKNNYKAILESLKENDINTAKHLISLKTSSEFDFYQKKSYEAICKYYISRKEYINAEPFMKRLFNNNEDSLYLNSYNQAVETQNHSQAKEIALLMLSEKYNEEGAISTFASSADITLSSLAMRDFKNRFLNKAPLFKDIVALINDDNMEAAREALEKNPSNYSNSIYLENIRALLILDNLQKKNMSSEKTNRYNRLIDLAKEGDFEGARDISKEIYIDIFLM